MFAHTQTTSFSLPTSSPVLAVLFCFPSLLSSPVQETNTGSLCPVLDLPSVQGGQVGGTCAGMSGPLPEARLLFHLIIKQTSLFVGLPRSQKTTQSSVLSLGRFSRNPRGMGTGSVWGLGIA